MASNPFGEVPALPVAVLFGVVVVVVQLVFLQRGGRFSWPRTALAAAIAVYAAGIFANTVFPIFLNPPQVRSRGRLRWHSSRFTTTKSMTPSQTWWCSCHWAS